MPSASPMASYAAIFSCSVKLLQASLELEAGAELELAHGVADAVLVVGLLDRAKVGGAMPGWGIDGAADVAAVLRCRPGRAGGQRERLRHRKVARSQPEVSEGPGVERQRRG